VNGSTHRKREVKIHVVRIITHGGSDRGSRLVDGVGNEKRKRKRKKRVKAGEKNMASF
jgi:hypothetical protein